MRAVPAAPTRRTPAACKERKREGGDCARHSPHAAARRAIATQCDAGLHASYVKRTHPARRWTCTLNVCPCRTGSLATPHPQWPMATVWAHPHTAQSARGVRTGAAICASPGRRTCARGRRSHDAIRLHGGRDTRGVALWPCLWLLLVLSHSTSACMHGCTALKTGSLGKHAEIFSSARARPNVWARNGGRK